MKIRYQHLLNRPLKSRYSKSKYLHVYLYFIEFSNPEEVEYELIAKDTNIPVHTVRSLMRPATNNESIADALVDLGVRAENIPTWFALSNTLKRMKKGTKKGPSIVRKTTRPQDDPPSSRPELEYLNLPYVVRTPEEDEDELLRKRIQAEVAAINRAKANALTFISLKLNQEREEQEREKQKERDIENILAKIRAKTIWNVLMRNFMFNQMMAAWIMSQPLHTENPKKELFDAIEKLFDVIINFIKDLNKRKPIPNVGLELELLEPEDWSDLNDQIKEILDDEPSLAENIKAVLELRDENQEKTRIRKLAMHGNQLQPHKIYWPPGFQPIQLLDGDRGKHISKLMNLNHLRPNGARDSKKHTE